MVTPFLLFAALIGCDRQGDVGSAPSPTKTKFVIAVVNSPLECFAKRIAGDHATLVFSCPAEIDPAHWKPDSIAIDEFQEADVVFANGLGYAGWLNYVTLAPSRVVDTSLAFRDSYIELDETLHTHGPGGEHSHSRFATHVWLNPKLATHQAECIRDTLIEKLPDHAAEFRKNYESLDTDLRGLDDQLNLLPAIDQPMLGSHPVFEYLADRCLWKLHSVVWEPNVAPSAEEWTRFVELANQTQARWMLWEGEPLDETRQKLERLGIGVIVFEPCGRVVSDDYFEKMRANIERLANALPK